MQVSFIIVNYNVTALLKRCLESIFYYAKDIDFEVIVIDNDSPDTSWLTLKNEFFEVKFIANKVNSGFSAANNVAAKTARGKYIFFLNPDTELEGFYLQEILNFAEQQINVGCIGLRMHDLKGNFLPESKRSVPSLMNSAEKLFNIFTKNNSKSYYRTDVAENEIAKVDILTGANLLIKKKVYDEAGGFDERYFMYGEDIDLCYTVLKLGYHNFYYGKYSILHHKGESTVKDRKYYKNFYGAMGIFADKYYSENLLKNFVIKTGIKLRFLISVMGK